MFGGINPGQMKAMMKQLGIKQEEIETSRVIIEKADGSGKIVIEPANVQKMIMQGQESWQVTGQAREEAAGISDSDITLVAEKTGKSKKEAKVALEKTGGDIAEAIVELS